MSFRHLNLELDPFIPILPVMTGHTQTVLGHIIPSEPLKVAVNKEILKLDDGDELLLEFSETGSPYTVSIYHGLAGDATSGYIRRSANIAAKLGWNVVLVNHRGVGTQAKRTYHSGRGEDASAVVSWARKKFPGTKHIALGFSMSGSILLNLVTGRYGVEQPDFAVVVNAPLDLAKSAELLSVGLSKVYDIQFYLLLKKIIQERENNQFPLPLVARTIDIDELYSSKVNGFKNAYDYYEQCSALKYLDRIKTKTFVLSSHDDPFIHVSGYLATNWNENVHLTLQKSGGHMGYFLKKKHPHYGHRWLDHYVGTVFEKIQSL